MASTKYNIQWVRKDENWNPDEGSQLVELCVSFTYYQPREKSEMPQRRLQDAQFKLVSSFASIVSRGIKTAQVAELRSDNPLELYSIIRMADKSGTTAKTFISDLLSQDDSSTILVGNPDQYDDASSDDDDDTE